MRPMTIKPPLPARRSIICEGYYEGNAARMERALSPSLTKRGLIFSPRSGASFLQQMNAEALIEVARAGWGKLPAEQRQIDYRLLDISGQYGFGARLQRQVQGLPASGQAERPMAHRQRAVAAAG